MTRENDDFAISSVAAPLRQQVENRLRRAILERRFKPGERLIERELCEILNVSKTAVRESLRRLEAEGLILSIPNRGPVVATLSLSDVKQIYQVREVLEGLAAREFARIASPEQRTALDAVWKRLLEAVSEEQDVPLVDIKEAFYEILLDGSGNAIAKQTLQTLNNRIRMLRETSLAVAARPLKTVEEIRLLMQAIAERNPQAAWEAAVAHVRSAMAAVLETLPDTNDPL